jgi:hypothetical protein
MNEFSHLGQIDNIDVRVYVIGSIERTKSGGSKLENIRQEVFEVGENLVAPNHTLEMGPKAYEQGSYKKMNQFLHYLRLLVFLEDEEEAW